MLTQAPLIFLFMIGDLIAGVPPCYEMESTPTRSSPTPANCPRTRCTIWSVRPAKSRPMYLGSVMDLLQRAPACCERRIGDSSCLILTFRADADWKYVGGILRSRAPSCSPPSQKPRRSAFFLYGRRYGRSERSCLASTR